MYAQGTVQSAQARRVDTIAQRSLRWGETHPRIEEAIRVTALVLGGPENVLARDLDTEGGGLGFAPSVAVARGVEVQLNLGDLVLVALLLTREKERERERERSERERDPRRSACRKACRAAKKKI